MDKDVFVRGEQRRLVNGSVVTVLERIGETDYKVIGENGKITVVPAAYFPPKNVD